MFTEAPTCPHLHPHMGTSGPVKRKRGILEANERTSTLDEPTDPIATSTGVYCISACFQRWLKGTLKATFLKEAPGFSWVFCLPSLPPLLLIPRPSGSARDMWTTFHSSLAKKDDIMKRKSRSLSLPMGYSYLGLSFQWWFPKWTLATSLPGARWFPCCHKLFWSSLLSLTPWALLFGPWLLWRCRRGPWGNEVTSGSRVESGGWNRTAALTN